ncbi:protein phosphatase 4 core regulatory subunit R2 [Lipomyces kononenkoae]|uniref:Protein phosphatase 4 core regulatory subunit R2 n=1 Tax=Lipomyces kononenkoae TaxID=34357 RepID=A0ACC3SXM6_LIPKO
MLLHEISTTGVFDETADWPAFRTRMGARLTEISTNNFVPEPTASQNSFLQSLLDTFNTSFSTAPPFTIQRLAELIERPNQHYGTHARDKYLRAIQRVVTVESSVGDFGMAAFGTSNSSTFSGTVGALSGNVLNENTGVVLSPIAWLIDTGTPPPDSPHEAQEADVKEEMEVHNIENQLINEERPDDEKIENGINGVDGGKKDEIANGDDHDRKSSESGTSDGPVNEGGNEEPMDIE